MKRTAIAYIRVSTEDQKLGPDAQRAAIQAYAQREGIEVLATFTDAGVSGAASIADRPALLAALHAVKVHRAPFLMVAKRDRLARDAFLAASIERTLPKGATIVSADGTGNGSAPSDALMRTILDGMAEYERALIRGRTKQALQAKRAKGQRAGMIPYGFDLAADGATLIPNADEQATIQTVRALHATGQTHRAIVLHLHASGVLSRKGKPLHLSQVQRMLKAS